MYLRRLTALNDRLARLCLAFCALILSVITAALTLSAVTRFVTGTGYDWLIESPPMLIPWMVFPMLGPLLRGGDHIQVDVLPVFLPPRQKNWLRTLVFAVALIAALVFLRAGFEAVQLFYRMGQTVELEFSFPIWLLYLAFPVGFAGLALFALESLLISIRAQLDR